jgi:hypothetical protein
LEIARKGLGHSGLMSASGRGLRGGGEYDDGRDQERADSHDLFEHRMSSKVCVSKTAVPRMVAGATPRSCPGDMAVSGIFRAVPFGSIAAGTSGVAGKPVGTAKMSLLTPPRGQA